MAVKTIQIADKPTLDATKALLEDSEVGLAAIKQAASSGAVSGSAGGLQIGKIIDEDVNGNIALPEIPSIYYFTYGCALAYDNGIVILGSSHDDYSKGLHQIYKDSSWKEYMAYLPYDFYRGSAVVWNGKIHILGGSGGQTKHYAADGSSSWASISTLPYDFYNGSAVVWNGKIHILGGSGGPTKHYAYDGVSWKAVSTLPYDFYRDSAVVWNGKIHILGGSGSGNYTKHYAYDGVSWEEVSTLPYDFYNGSAVVYNDELHILGGGYSDNVHYGTNHYAYDGIKWSNTTTLPYDFYGGAAVAFGDEIHIIGGASDPSDSKKHYSVKYDTRHIATVLPKGIHILLSDNENITYVSDNTTKISETIAEVKETGYVEILTKYLNPSKVRKFLTFY